MPETTPTPTPAVLGSERPQPERPQIVNYASPSEFARDMLSYRKQTEPGFSVQTATQSLRRVSPALVSLVLSAKRRMTLDRADEFSKLLNLNSGERFYLRSWLTRVEQSDGPTRSLGGGGGANLPAPSPHPGSERKEVSTHILTDWLNAYVKDLFQFPAVQKEPSRLNVLLSAIAKPNRVRRALDFLLREGHLRRTLAGEIILETQLAVTDAQISSQKIRRFHKNALGIARDAIDLYSPAERLANTLVIPLSENDHQELLTMMQDFAERLKVFAETRQETPDRLYQFVTNLSPIGGKIQ